MTHLLPLWDLIFTIALLILGGFFGMLYFAHRINKDTTFNFRGEYFTRAVKVWHSPEEVPKNIPCTILVYHKGLNRYWQGPAAEMLSAKVTRWAYISDLEKLPGYSQEGKG